MHSGTDALHLVDTFASGCQLIGARDSLLPPPRDRDAPASGHAALTPTLAAARTGGRQCDVQVHPCTTALPAASLYSLIPSSSIPDSEFTHRSNIAVTPIPPAVQIEINPRPEPFCASSFASVATIRAPVAANG